MKKTNGTPVVALAVILWVGAVGCAKNEQAEVEEPAAAPVEAPAEDAAVGQAMAASATLEPRSGTAVAGMVMFSEEGDGVAITAHIEGAPPGTHGLHIHEVGDCSSEDFKSAGGHFNPSDGPHGSPDDAERHAGDLGNIEIGENGSGHFELVSDMISLGDGENSIIGRGVILHQKADDLVSQPTGAAGSRLACGVVEAADLNAHSAATPEIESTG